MPSASRLLAFLIALPALGLWEACACDAVVATTDGGSGEGEGEGGGEGEGEGDPHALVINEVGCAGGGADFVELKNVGVSPIATGGLVVTDNPLDLSRRASVAAVLQPGEWAVVPLTTFGVSCGVDSIVVLDGAVRLDSVAVADLPTGATYGRIPDGTGPFQPTQPTPGDVNLAFTPLDAALFDPFEDEVEVELTLPPTSVDGLNADARTYVVAQLRVTLPTGRSYGPIDVGVRLKGKIGSFRSLAEKAAFKIDTDRFVVDQRLFGLEKINLNNMVQDRSAVHEWMAYELFRARGIPAPRVGSARVSVNGEDYGAYLIIEAVDDPNMLARSFPSTLAVYEGEYGQDLFPDAIDDFDLDAGLDPGRASLLALATAANYGNGPDFFSNLEPVLDWEEVLAMMSMEVLIGHWDGYGPTRNNYFLHADNAGVYSMMPWGADQTFVVDWPLFEGQGLLLYGCLRDPLCMPLWQQALDDSAALAHSRLAAGFGDEVAALAALQQTRFITDPRVEWSPAEIPTRAQSAVEYLVRRAGQVHAELECVRDPAQDQDGDGRACALDCDEGNAARYFAAPEICGNLQDEDCNGFPDDGNCPDCVLDPTLTPSTYFCRSPRSYVRAQANCTDLGGRLVVLNDLARADAVHARAQFWWSSEAYWIGFDDRGVEGTFVWSDGVVRAFTRWSGNEPNDTGGNEDCAQVRGVDPLWNDSPCEANLVSVCEMP